MKTNANQRGVTLVEIAIVLVVIGLLLGGILKGQELINNAKIRAVVEQQKSLLVAWHAFVDRFQAMPGDYPLADTYITGAAVSDTAPNLTGDGEITAMESPLALQNLTAAGYLKCRRCIATAPADPAAGNSLKNVYGGIVSIFHNGHDGTPLYAYRGLAASQTPALQVHTGWSIPSNILAEVDRKTDDGVANTGEFVFNEYIAPTLPPGAQPSAADCMSASNASQTDGVLVDANPMYWRFASSTAGLPVWSECGGASHI